MKGPQEKPPRNRPCVVSEVQAAAFCQDERDNTGSTVKDVSFPQDGTSTCFKVLQADCHGAFPVWSSRGAVMDTSIKNSTKVVSHRLPLPKMLCCEKGSEWRMLCCVWLRGHTKHHPFLSKERLDIKTTELRQQVVQTWCARNVPGLLLQVYVTVVQRYES